MSANTERQTDLQHISLIAHIARKSWWHVTPRDADAYQKRGKFYASTFTEAEFYGRPGDPERVRVRRPLVGDEEAIEATLFGRYISSELACEGEESIEERFALDARMKTAAVKRGYDAIVLMSPKGYACYLAEGKFPRAIELNILSPPFNGI